MQILPFGESPRLGADRGIDGLFWLMPECWQRARIRELRRSLPERYVTLLTRREVSAVRDAMEPGP